MPFVIFYLSCYCEWYFRLVSAFGGRTVDWFTFILANMSGLETLLMVIAHSESRNYQTLNTSLNFVLNNREKWFWNNLLIFWGNWWLIFQKVTAQFDSGLWQCYVSATTYLGERFFFKVLIVRYTVGNYKW